MRYLLAVVAALALAPIGRAELIELAPPGQEPGLQLTSLSLAVVFVDRDVVVHSIGAFFDPESFRPPPFDFITAIALVHDLDKQIASGFPITLPNSAILGWHDAPIDVHLAQGLYRFELLLSVSPAVNGFFEPSPPFTIGPFTVLGSQPVAHLTQIRIDATVIPEPSAWLLGVTALSLASLHLLSRTRLRRLSA